MRTEIKELHQRLKTTSIYVTHDQIEAMTMADKIVVMKDGLVEQTGDPLTLYDRPSNTFVAGFIGSPAMNMIPGVVGNTGSVDFGAAAALPLPKDARVDSGREVLYGVRPEHCALAAAGLPVEVVVVEPTGADTQLYCRFNGQDVTATIKDRTDCRPGDRIHLAPDLGRAHVFDAATGQRLVA
jgi:multiple sugar transport system ATP-binding protein